MRRVEEAVARSQHWAEEGWLMTFGSREEVVASLQQARELPEAFVCRAEAVDYWQVVAQTGHEAASWGQKALAALRQHDLDVAERAIYQAQYLERPFARRSATWQPVYVLLRKTLSWHYTNSALF